MWNGLLILGLRVVQLIIEEGYFVVVLVRFWSWVSLSI